MTYFRFSKWIKNTLLSMRQTATLLEIHVSIRQQMRDYVMFVTWINLIKYLIRFNNLWINNKFILFFRSFSLNNLSCLCCINYRLKFYIDCKFFIQIKLVENNCRAWIEISLLIQMSKKFCALLKMTIQKFRISINARRLFDILCFQKKSCFFSNNRDFWRKS